MLTRIATTVATPAVAVIALRQWQDTRYYLRAWIGPEWNQGRSTLQGASTTAMLMSIGEERRRRRALLGAARKVPVGLRTGERPDLPY